MTDFFKIDICYVFSNFKIILLPQLFLFFISFSMQIPFSVQIPLTNVFCFCFCFRNCPAGDLTICHVTVAALVVKGTMMGHLM